MNPSLYPPSPDLPDYEFIKPSREFRKVATTVVLSIVLFFLFYMMLIAVAAGLMVGAGALGVALITFRVNAFTLGAGLGIIVLGVMLFAFSIKFIFSRKKYDDSMRMELKKQDHPDLFAFIKILTRDIKSDFPKKIFVSHGVNAMVFYNSSFWSLFFPVRKNLEIGLGLVNTLTISEFKSVLAHEFGHFSQRSMKIGSYIYTVNRAIYNLVYEYDAWDKLLSQWSQVGGLFGIFAGVTFWMVERVRSLLKMAYNLINIHYLKLSREMEYHADLMAISVSGNAPFKNALRKVEFSSFTYDYTVNHLNALAAKERASDNIYSNHSYTLTFLAKHNKLGDGDGARKISDQDMENSVIKSRVNVKDQWASHPTLKEREANIASVQIECDEYSESAWLLFTNREDLQQRITKSLYQTGFPNSNFSQLETNEYTDFVNQEINKYSIAEVYNGFYDNRYFTEFDPKQLSSTPIAKNFSQLYSRQNVERIKRYTINKMDLELLRQINLKEVPARHFEFDGEKYKRRDAGRLIDALMKEIDQEAKDIEELDRDSFRFHYHLAKQCGEGDALMEMYKKFFFSMDSVKTAERMNERLQDFAAHLYSQPRWTAGEIKGLVSRFSSIETEFKYFLSTQSLEAIQENIETEAYRKVVEEYLNSSNLYSAGYDFSEQSFIKLSNLMAEVFGSVGKLYGTALKKLTDYQLRFQTAAAGNAATSTPGAPMSPSAGV